MNFFLGWWGEKNCFLSECDCGFAEKPFDGVKMTRLWRLKGGWKWFDDSQKWDVNLFKLKYIFFNPQKICEIESKIQDFYPFTLLTLIRWTFSYFYV